MTATVNDGSGTSQLQWQVYDLVLLWQDIAGATQLSYTTGTLNSGTHSYRARVLQGEGCLAYSDSVTINVVPDPIVTISVNDDVICDGGVVVFNSTVSGGTGPAVYQWQLRDGSNNWVNIGGANADTLESDVLLTGTHRYRRLS